MRSADGYEDQMMTEAKVMPSFAKRREKIVHDVVRRGPRDRRRSDHARRLDRRSDGVDRVAGHLPVFSFEEEFLKVPQECLILDHAAKSKVFCCVQDEKGRLMNRFFLVSQLEAKDGGVES